MEDGLGRKQSKKQLNNFLISSMPKSELMNKISPRLGGTIGNSTFPVKSTAHVFGACLWRKELLTLKITCWLLAWKNILCVSLPWPGRLLDVCFWYPYFPVKWYRDSWQSFYGFIYTMLLWDGEMWLIFFTGRELKQSETKAQICGDLKKPSDTPKFERKNTNPTKNQPQSISY